MKILTEKKFCAYKKSDTIVVYGCGSSINKLATEDRARLDEYDSIGFNWFCFSQIPTTFYVVREQANIPVRIDNRGGETVANFIEIINKPPYNKSCLIIHDLSQHSKHIYRYDKNIDRFVHKGIVVKDVKLPLHRTGIKQWRKKSILQSGVYHGLCTLNNVLHIAVNLGYERIIFCGVDLHNSKYFWMPKRKTRHTVKRRGHSYRVTHATALPILTMIPHIKKHHKQIEMYVFKYKSLLNQKLPVMR